MQVTLEPPPLGVAGSADRPRPRGAQLLDPRPQLRLQPLVLKRQCSSRARRAYELRLVVQSQIVGDRGDPPAAHLGLPVHPAPDTVDAADLPERVDVALRLRQPVRQRHR